MLGWLLDLFRCRHPRLRWHRMYGTSGLQRWIGCCVHCDAQVDWRSGRPPKGALVAEGTYWLSRDGKRLFRVT